MASDTTLSLVDRIRAHRRRLIKAGKVRTRASARWEAARASALLDIRDDAYRRLLVRNQQLEAERRFAEAVGTAIAAQRGAGAGSNGHLLDVILARFAELELDRVATGTRPTVIVPSSMPFWWGGGRAPLEAADE